MILRRHALTLGACLLLPLSVPAAAADSPRATPAPAENVAARGSDPGEIFAPRARRLAQAYLRLRLLELREADFARVRAVIEHRLPVDSLLDATPSPKAVVR